MDKDIEAVTEIVQRGKSRHIPSGDIARQIDDYYKKAPPSLKLISDEELREKFKKYYTEEQMNFPEEYFDIITGIIAIVRQAQLDADMKAIKDIPLSSAQNPKDSLKEEK